MIEGGIPPFPGVRVMPVETRRFIVEVLEVVVTRIEVFADSPERAAQIVESRDIRKEPTYFGHVSINIAAAPEAAGETIERDEDDRDARGRTGGHATDGYDKFADDYYEATTEAEIRHSDWNA